MITTFGLHEDFFHSYTPNFPSLLISIHDTGREPSWLLLSRLSGGLPFTFTVSTCSALLTKASMWRTVWREQVFEYHGNGIKEVLIC